MNIIKCAKSILVALTVLSAFPFVVHAAPSVQSVIGTVSQGQAITVGGLGFGTKSPVRPYLWADFNSGSINPSNLGTVTSWLVNQSMAYNASEGINGGGCTKSTDISGIWTLGISSSGFNWSDYSQASYIYRKIKRNFPIPANWKVWRMWPTGYGYPNIYAATSNSAAFVEGIMGSAAWFNGSGNFGGTTNAWHSEEIVFRSNSSSGAADGILQLYGEGVNAASFTNIHANNGGSVMALNFPLHGVIANDAIPSGGAYWADDVYVDNTWARVMVCTGSTWSSRGHCEIQIPNTTWGNTQLQVQVNQGSFANGATGYLYVIDATGAASQGGTVSRVIFGSGSSSQGASVAPGNLR